MMIVFIRKNRSKWW